MCGKTRDCGRADSGWPSGLTVQQVADALQGKRCTNSATNTLFQGRKKQINACARATRKLSCVQCDCEKCIKYTPVAFVEIAILRVRNSSTMKKIVGVHRIYDECQSRHLSHKEWMKTKSTCA